MIHEPPGRVILLAASLALFVGLAQASLQQEEASASTCIATQTASAMLLQASSTRSRSVHLSDPVQDERPVVWMVWVGTAPMRPLHMAAVDSCVRANGPSLPVRVVTDDDLRDAPSRLGFDLHPSFHLLDAPEKADYLRAELLYYHGGIYLDTDVFCLKSLQDAYESSIKDVGAAVENVAALGPYRAKDKYMTQWHEALHEQMDALTPRLENCAQRHPDGQGGIIYPKRSHEGPNICGTVWGEVIDFMEPHFNQWRDARAAAMQTVLTGHRPEAAPEGDFSGLGRALHVCSLDGHPEKGTPCDVAHASTAGMAWDLVDLSGDLLCQRFPFLRATAPLCPDLQDIGDGDFS